MAVSTSSIFQNLSSILENQLLSNSSLDISSNGQIQKYGKLGEFAKKFDQTAERRYVEQGYYQNNFFGSIHQVQKNSEVLFQEPEATILVKKRMFSTLAENTRLDYMDFDEKLFYKASKILFQNKANQIAAFEKLSKIERIAVAMGQVDTQLFPLLVNLSDLIKDNYYSGQSTKFSSAIDKIRQIVAFQNPNTTTTWLSDQLNTYKSQTGAGTGVIELTNITGFSNVYAYSIINPGRGVEYPYTTNIAVTTTTANSQVTVFGENENYTYVNNFSSTTQVVTVENYTQLFAGNTIYYLSNFSTNYNVPPGLATIGPARYYGVGDYYTLTNAATYTFRSVILAYWDTANVSVAGFQLNDRNLTVQTFKR